MASEATRQGSVWAVSGSKQDFATSFRDRPIVSNSVHCPLPSSVSFPALSTFRCHTCHRPCDRSPSLPFYQALSNAVQRLTVALSPIMQSLAVLPAGRVRRKRKSQPPAAPAYKAAPSAAAWDELEQQIEQTLSEQPPLSSHTSATTLLSHSYSTPSFSTSYTVSRAADSATPSWLHSSTTPEHGSPTFYASGTSPASSYSGCSCLSPALSSPSSHSAYSPVYASPSSASSPSCPAHSALTDRANQWQPSLSATSSSDMLDAGRLKQLARHKPAARSPPPSSFCLLSSLYHELVLRCLGFLDIPSLCRVSTTCRWLRVTSEDWQLWSELYVSRWPVDRERTERREQWKSDYRDKEVQEEAAFFAQDNDYTAATTPQPAAAADDELADEKAAGGLSRRDMENQWRHLYRATLRRNRQWKRHINEFTLIQSFIDTHQPERGHTAASPLPCSFLSCSFHVLLPDLWVCRSSHRVHFCLPSCWADEDDHRCRVTGRWATETSVQRIDGEDETEVAADEETAAMDGAGQTHFDFLMSCYEHGAEAVAVNGELSIWAREGRDDEEMHTAAEVERRRREAMQMDSAFSSDSKRRQSGSSVKYVKKRRTTTGSSI